MEMQLTVDPSALNETQLQCFITFIQSFLDASPHFQPTYDERAELPCPHKGVQVLTESGAVCSDCCAILY